MAVLQSSYAAGIASAVAGLIANMETQNTITRLCEDTTIGFGKACFQGTADNEVTATASAAFVGISVIDTTLENSIADVYAEGDNMGILNKGVIWVVAGDDVAAGEAVYVDGDGKFVESESGATELPNVVFDSSGAADALVKIRLR
jgi:hypothetical protein